MNNIAPIPNPRLDHRDLRLVLALATAGSTAGAASLLHLTQPAVSRALLAAEARLGRQLFIRSPQGLLPTEAGQCLLDSAPRLLTDLQALEQRLCAPAATPTRLRLVCECYTAYHWVPSVLAELRMSMPDLELEIAAQSAQDPVSALLANEIDVALVTGASVPASTLLQETALFADEVVFVVSSRSPLAQRETLSRADLATRPLLTTHLPTPGMHWFNHMVAGPADQPLRYQYLPLTEALLDFARADLGIAVLSEWIAAPHLHKGDLIAKRLATGPLHRPWRLVWRSEHADAAWRLHAALALSAPRLPPLQRSAPQLAAAR
ncbi:LysR family transcriptional regulator, regulator for metE and metH [Andreprevotia lacus DSM 23236]|jgi:LysR family transcriptional regulator for metE and metH|uniref:LysR family transcriptional regulator, regulator for metE and metH n=1 Tax=Andreprevotia lacus DSM 23236 TaxID=1121001 RepID=A0A1W1Y169_9NEIS|nr:LysR family transcriptional regulator [Andreprevotia lacus]SMC29885.1 LysR family transcriptional regulator, regulator for metE and metH [Andreprevotia lacus DSM 23236]